MNNSDTVVVIGGSSGMGLAVARRCLADGASVVIAGRSAKRLEAARAELGCPGRLRAVTADIGDRAQVAALFEQAATIRHLVVTAADLPYGPVTALTEDSLMRAVRSKFLGPFFAAQEAAPAWEPPGASPSPPALPHTGPRRAVHWPPPPTGLWSPWSARSRWS